MNKIYNNLTYRNLIKTDWIEQFDEAQQREIKSGIENKVDLSVYAKTEYDSFQMFEIRIGLQGNLDVSYYTNPDFGPTEMNLIRTGLRKGLNVSEYAKQELNWEEMQEIRKRLERKQDYEKRKYDFNKRIDIISQYLKKEDIEAIKKKLEQYKTESSTIEIEGKTPLLKMSRNNWNFLYEGIDFDTTITGNLNFKKANNL